MREPWRDFARGLSGDAAPALAHLRAFEGATSDQRFDIHRRNRRAALVDCLAARHPVLVAMVGDAFFAALALEYVRRHPPRSPALHEYGERFAEFLDDYPPAQAVACLPDMARLEHAWQIAFHAADAPPVQLRDLAGLAPEALASTSFTAHPATRLVSSAHPVASLWLAHQGTLPGEPLDATGGECALLVRPRAEVRVLAFAPEARGFIESLLAGDPVERAAMTHPDLDHGATLQRLVQGGAFAVASC